MQIFAWQWAQVSECLPPTTCLQLVLVEGENLRVLDEDPLLFHAEHDDFAWAPSAVAAAVDEAVALARLEEEGIFLLKSDNPLFEPYTLEATQILEVWQALGFLSFELPSYYSKESIRFYAAKKSSFVMFLSHIIL